jgi:hypothetical protein
LTVGLSAVILHGHAPGFTIDLAALVVMVIMRLLNGDDQPGKTKRRDKIGGEIFTIDVEAVERRDFPKARSMLTVT